MLLWFGDYGQQIAKKSLYNPKLIYWGSPKTHEIYFLILMSLIGCDILVLNTSFKDRFDQVDKRNEFSFLINKGNERQISDFPRKESHDEELQKRIEKPQPLVEERPKQENTTESNLSAVQNLIGLDAPAIVVKLKKSESIFEDIFVPMTQRSGYIGGPISNTSYIFHAIYWRSRFL